MGKGLMDWSGEPGELCAQVAPTARKPDRIQAGPVSGSHSLSGAGASSNLCRGL